MSVWVIIIAKIIELIAGGVAQTDAVKTVAKMYNVSEKDIWKKGGF